MTECGKSLLLHAHFWAINSKPWTIGCFIPPKCPVVLAKHVTSQKLKMLECPYDRRRSWISPRCVHTARSPRTDWRCCGRVWGGAWRRGPAWFPPEGEHSYCYRPTWPHHVATMRLTAMRHFVSLSGSCWLFIQRSASSTSTIVFINLNIHQILRFKSTICDLVIVTFRL